MPELLPVTLYAMKKEIISMSLYHIPPDVNTIISDEQLRLKLFKRADLKKPNVVYEIIREWQKLKVMVK